ncbi:MAG: GntR family transcriptional regulator [Polyangiales bacterium]
MLAYSPLPDPAPSPSGPGKTLPDRIVEYFIARIFTGDLPAGERLPPDRELAPMLAVDRTSLRMALQQLARLGLVKIVHGSGVRVLDFREHAGLDFLALVFSLPGLSLGGSYLLQVLDDWIDFMPAIAGRSLASMSHEARRAIDSLMAEQLSQLDRNAELERVIDLEVQLQDRVLRTGGNTGLILLGNSSRPLRRQLLRLYFEASDVRQHVTTQRALFHELVSAPSLRADEIAAIYRAFLVECTTELRARLQALPMNPSLIAPPGAARA